LPVQVIHHVESTLIAGSVVPVTFERGSHVLRYEHNREFGELDRRTFKFLEVLSGEDRIALQLYCQPESRDDSLTLKRPRQGQVCSVSLSVVIYGCPELFDSVGDFVSCSRMFLQDPQRCDRNVKYRNPHRLSWSDDENQYTQSINTVGQVPVDIRTFEAPPDQLVGFESEENHLETEGSSKLKTPLYR
jgi:SWI/SNF-related matrix-associated actin-dependent regulator of chromatin subfamily A3